MSIYKSYGGPPHDVIPGDEPWQIEIILPGPTRDRWRLSVRELAEFADMLEHAASALCDNCGLAYCGHYRENPDFVYDGLIEETL